MGMQSGITPTGSVQWSQSIVRARGKPERVDQLIRHQSKTGGQISRYILLDCSSSMLRYGQLEQAKAWILTNHLASATYLSNAFLVSARGSQFESRRCVSSPVQFRQQLNDVSAGGGTPLNAALEWIAKAHRPQISVELWLVSDGRFELENFELPAAIDVMCVDCEVGPVRLNRMEKYARTLDAQYVAAHREFSD